jgi:hypothetical protein
MMTLKVINVISKFKWEAAGNQGRVAINRRDVIESSKASRNLSKFIVNML